jgi:CRISPR-associated protein Cas2
VRVVVTYDVSDDARRARLAARLSMWGNRVERSVFECTLPEDGVAQLVGDVESLVDLTRDVVHVYRQCSDCRGAGHIVGAGERQESVRYWVV